MSAPTLRFTLDTAAQAQWRAPTPIQPANLQALLKSGKVIVGAALTFPSRHVAKAMALTGADWCWLDTEHIPWSQKLLVECIQIIIHESGGKMLPVVRIPSKTAKDYIQWSLDAGAAGIVIPHMESAEDAKWVVDACRFPPIGHRSYPPFTYLPGLNDATPEGETVFSMANKHIAIIPQIESAIGVENLAEIIAVEGVSAFMVGLGDLRMDLGFAPGMLGDESTFVAASEKITKVAKERGMPMVGFAHGPEMTKLRIDQGYRMLINTMDLYALVFGVIHEVSTGKAAAEEQMQSLSKKSE